MSEPAGNGWCGRERLEDSGLASESQRRCSIRGMQHFDRGFIVIVRRCVVDPGETALSDEAIDGEATVEDDADVFLRVQLSHHLDDTIGQKMRKPLV